MNLEKKLVASAPGMRAINAESVTRLKPEYFTLAEALHAEGYATAHFGKWHPGYDATAADHYEPKVIHAHKGGDWENTDIAVPGGATARSRS